MMSDHSLNAPSIAALGSKSLRVSAGSDSFQVEYAPGLLNQTSPTLYHCIANELQGPSNRAFILVSQSPFHHYGHSLTQYLESYGILYQLISLPADLRGERTKSIEAAKTLSETLKRQRPRRGDCLIIFGGGALHDIGKFVASVFRRGDSKRLIYIPTTPISAVDASLSLKSAVNVGFYKNLLGTRLWPSWVLIDPLFLKSVDPRAQKDGMAEIVKAALVGSPELYEQIELHGEEAIDRSFQNREGQKMIWDAARLFLELGADRRSAGRAKSIRSFGHAFSRSIEEHSRFLLSHGEAISIEQACAVELGFRKNMISADERQRVLECFDKLGLAAWHNSIDAERLWEDVFEDAFAFNESFDFPTFDRIGRGAYIDRFDFALFEESLEACRQRARDVGRYLIAL